MGRVCRPCRVARGGHLNKALILFGQPTYTHPGQLEPGRTASARRRCWIWEGGFVRVVESERDCAPAEASGLGCSQRFNQLIRSRVSAPISAALSFIHRRRCSAFFVLTRSRRSFRVQERHFSVITRRLGRTGKAEADKGAPFWTKLPHRCSSLTHPRILRVSLRFFTRVSSRVFHASLQEGTLDDFFFIYFSFHTFKYPNTMVTRSKTRAGLPSVRFLH